jgi:hypothetical protein
MRQTLLIAFLVFTASLFTAGNLRADNSDLQACLHGEDTVSRIKSCTRIIESDQANKDVLYAALTDRCAEYNGLKRYPEALADCSAAIKLRPDSEAAYIKPLLVA